MADNDIFRKHVHKDFQHVSRTVVRHGDIDRGLLWALKAVDTASIDWSQSEIELVRRIHEATLLPEFSTEERDPRIDAIDSIASSAQSDFIRSVARYAQESLSESSPDCAEFFARAIARFVTTQAFPLPAIADAVNEFERSLQEISGDMASFERRLREFPELLASAKETLARPKSKIIRSIRPRADTKLLLQTPLEELAS